MRNMKNTCAGVNLEYSLLFRYCARRFCIELMVGAPQKRLQLHLKELQSSHQGGKIIHAQSICLVKFNAYLLFCFAEVKVLLFNSEVDTVLSLISHSCDSKDKLMISKSSIVVFFASLFYQRLHLFHIYFIICYDLLLRIWLTAN